MQKQDLSKIDFNKCEVTLWKNQRLRVRLATIVEEGAVLVHEGLSNGGWIARRVGGKWEFAAKESAEHLAQLSACCAQVDTFISAELARLEEPDWVEVKWTEVVRLVKSGARVQYFNEVSKRYIDRETPIGLACPSVRYRVDRKTVPDGVALYEPEWVEVHASDIWRLIRESAVVEVQNPVRGTWGKLEKWHVHQESDAYRYRVDRKTCPPGWEKRKTEAARKTVTKTADEFLRELIANAGSMYLASFRGTEGRHYVYRAETGLHKSVTADGGGETRVDLGYFFQVGPYDVEPQ